MGQNMFPQNYKFGIWDKTNSHKMVKHTQTIRRQFADELYEYVSPFCGVGA